MNVQMLFRSIVVTLLVLAGFLVVQSNEQAREAEKRLQEWDKKYQTLFLQMQGLNASISDVSTQLLKSAAAIDKVKKEARKSRKIEEKMQEHLQQILIDSGLAEPADFEKSNKKKDKKNKKDSKADNSLDRPKYKQAFDQRKIGPVRQRFEYIPERERPGFEEKVARKQLEKKTSVKKKQPYDASYAKLLQALSKLNRVAYLLAENKNDQAVQALKDSRDDMWSAGKRLPEEKDRDKIYKLMDPVNKLIAQVEKDKVADLEPVHDKLQAILAKAFSKKKAFEKKERGGREKNPKEKRMLAKVQLSWALAKVEEAEKLMYQSRFDEATKHLLSAKSDVWKARSGISEIETDLQHLMYPMRSLAGTLTEKKKTDKLADVSDTLYALLEYVGEPTVRQNAELDQMRLAYLEEEGGKSPIVMLPKNKAQDLLLNALKDVDKADKMSSKGEYGASAQLLEASKGKIWQASDMLKDEQPALKKLMGPIDSRIRSYQSGRVRSLKRVKTVLEDVLNSMGGH